MLTHIVAVRLDDATHRKLTGLARHRRMTVSDVVRVLMLMLDSYMVKP